MADTLDTSAFLAHWLTHRTLAQRKFPSVILRNRSNRFSLEIHAEQAPRADSRVTLAERIDALGMPQLRVDWRYSVGDIESPETKNPRRSPINSRILSHAPDLGNARSIKKG